MEHSVETQWHYEILTKYGFTAITRKAEGYVRSYSYTNKEGCEIVCTTGASCDHWLDKTNHNAGLWSALEPHLTKTYVPK